MAFQKSTSKQILEVLGELFGLQGEFLVEKQKANVPWQRTAGLIKPTAIILTDRTLSSIQVKSSLTPQYPSKKTEFVTGVLVTPDTRKKNCFGWGLVRVCATPNPAAGWALGAVRALAPHMRAKKGCQYASLFWC